VIIFILETHEKVSFKPQKRGWGGGGDGIIKLNTKFLKCY